MSSVDSLGPWFYEFDIGTGERTQSKLPPDVRAIHATRLQMINSVLDRHFRNRAPQTLSCLDIACHEGYFAIEMAKLGLRSVLGIDLREESLSRARVIAQLLKLKNVQFRQLNAEQVSPDVTGEVDLTLFLGLLYHLENPMLCLRKAALVTRELCLLETQIIDEVEGETEWGARAWKRPYRGVLALIDETGEFDAANAETGATPLAMCPSRRGLITMLEHAGFRKVEFVDPPPNGYEQMVRQKRVVCAAYK